MSGTAAQASMLCCTIGRPATGNRGLGTSRERGRKRVPGGRTGDGWSDWVMGDWVKGGLGEGGTDKDCLGGVEY